MKISLKVQLIILIIISSLIALEIVVLVFYTREKLFPVFDTISQIFRRSEGDGLEDEKGLTVKGKKPETDEETLKRIKELEEKIKELEEKQRVPFPNKQDIPPLTKDQISAIVELWCPADDYNYSGFISIGSGSIVHSDGLIFTNRHVVSNYDWSVIESSPTCYVAITDDISQPPEVKYMADLVAYASAPPDYPYTEDFDFDVAVLYIYDVCYECIGAPSFLPSNFPYLELGYSDILVPGDYVAIAGYPEIGAETFNFTEGVISGRVGDFVLKTDAKIDSGNSGGSALDSKHRLIGMPTWTISGAAESMGYIIGIDQITNWWESKVIPSESIDVPY